MPLRAPNALAWNIVGFGAVGVLVVMLAWGIWRQANAPVAASFVALSGVAFAAAGVFPADMSNFEADTTRLHILASLVSFAAFAAAVPAVSWRLWRCWLPKFRDRGCRVRLGSGAERAAA